MGDSWGLFDQLLNMASMPNALAQGNLSQGVLAQQQAQLANDVGRQAYMQQQLMNAHPYRPFTDALFSPVPHPPLPLEPYSDETFERWVNTPATDLRTLEEFAADGGI